ncbi:MAG: Ycf66 family protein [Pleurocapsa sp. MO_192.B19]|nr:Ycf66 family protein [Pleurocapsa sp. MO_192.B19]
MVNFGLNAAAILGLVLAVAGAGLFFLRSIRPELARDYDIFFAAVGLLCGIILLFNGWRLDPILQFGQFLLTGTAIFFAFESIRMRSVATEQARRNTPTVDRDRPVSRTRVYTEAELDKFDTYDNYEGTPNYNSPRLRGYDDPQPRPPRRPTERRRSAPETEIRDEPRRSRSRPRPKTEDYASRNSQAGGYSYEDGDSRPRRRPTTPSPADSYDDWSANDEWNDSPNPNPRPRPRPRPRPTREERYSEPTPPPNPKRRPNATELGRSYEEPENDSYGRSNLGRDYDAELGRSYEDDNESIPGDYVVDYQPVENSEPDYSDDYDAGDGDEYDDYDHPEDSRSTDEYDDYSDRPERRKPINFNDYD